MARAWREPVLRWPVLVIESDDWGAGPATQAAALRTIAELLVRHADANGHPACLSLALVLAVPDAERMSTTGSYERLELDAPAQVGVLRELLNGVARGVFALQLHCYEHYWPPALLRVEDPTVRRWIEGGEGLATEALPSHLQSRWVDAAMLPSAPLSFDDIHRAADEECSAFTRIIGAPPHVVVPPTFVWTRAVEQAWGDAGIEFVVTPGWRATRREASGLPGGDEGPITAGERAGPLTYLVRSDYFEPARGRGADHALRALARAAAEGRACVLENHRDNFIAGDDAGRHNSFAELDALCSLARVRFPEMRFLATAELGRILRDRDPQWLVHPWRERLPFVWQRLRRSGRLWKLLRLLGLALPCAALVRVAGRTPVAPGALNETLMRPPSAG